MALLGGVGVIWTPIVGASTPAPTLCPSSPSDSPFLGTVHASGDLVVPAGESCGLYQGSTVGHNVVVNKGAQLFAMGTTVGHDVLADHAGIIEIGNPNDGTTGVRVGHDLIIKNMESGGGIGNFICQTTVGHNLVLEGTSQGAPMFDVGYPDPYNCGRNTTPGDVVKHSLTATRNAGTVEVGENRVGNVLKFTHNSSPNDMLFDNLIGDRCHFARSKGLHEDNRVKHGANNCNATAP